MNGVESCYLPELARAIAIAIESGLTAETDALERKLKARYGKELNLAHFRHGIKEARAAIVKAAASVTGKFITGETGAIVPNLANAITMLRDLDLRYNSFTARPFLTDASPWGTSGNWTDFDDLKCTEWCQRNALNVKKDTVADAAAAVAQERKPHFNPVATWLQTLKHDGEPRLDRWLYKCLGAPDNSYVRKVAAKWMISAVKRIMEPGCQADYTLVLEGTQGKQKSTALRTLCGGEWFSDDIADMGTKDSAMQLQGKWIVELAELDAFRKAEMTTVKAWLVRREDNFRPPYGRRAENFPRQNVFAASTNKEDWLNDDTGGRRFWPVRTGEIDIPAIAAAREQLWAEAYARYMAGETTYLDESTEAIASQEQADRQESHAWKDLIEGWIQHPLGAALESHSGRVYLPEILKYCLRLQEKDWGRAKGDVSRILRVAGWVCRRTSRKDAEDDGRRPEYWVRMKKG